jgi:hypothetical protein
LIKDIKKDVKNLKLTIKNLRIFALFLEAIGLILLIFLFLKNYNYFLPIGSVLLILLFVVFIFPRILRYPYIIWMTFSLILNWIISRIILILFFYLIFTPIGLFLRLFKKDILDKNLQKSKTSYWEKKIYNTDNNRYKKQF